MVGGLNSGLNRPESQSAQGAGILSREGGPSTPYSFYETISMKIGLSRAPFCLFLGASIFLLHYILSALYRTDIFVDRSYLLSIMISIILYLVMWATAKLRRFAALIPNIFGLESTCGTYERILARTLSNALMIRYGLVFGVLNCLFGLVYGVWYRDAAMFASVIVQFIIVGFICGLAICGIAGIIKMVFMLNSERAFRLNVFHPDSCGGTASLGDLLLGFSAGDSFCRDSY